MSLLSRTAGGFASGLPNFNVALAAVGAIARNVSHRRAARQVAELPDYLLTDIGLKRDDVHDALTSDWHEDPTYRMAVSAARGRRAR